ncbi:MAG: hypothetical protein H7Y04_16905 [Verrucomicrobia bacterium]|nr:hypothetical protein [Cytophagales bacterium]
METQDFSALSNEKWNEIDNHLFEGRRIVAISTTKNALNIGLQDAVDLIVDRFNKLAIESPQYFKEDIKTYWDNTTLNPLFTDGE